MSQPLTWSSNWKWNQPGLVWNGTAPTDNPKRNMAIHVSLGFAKLKDTELSPFAVGVVTGLTGNATFTTPPVLAAALGTFQKNFEAALAKALKGSVADTGAKDEARENLVDALRQDAIYVEQLSQGDAAKIASSGYQTVSHAHSPRATMPKANIKHIKNVASGQMEVGVDAIDDAHAFEAHTQTGTGQWQWAATSSSRKVLIQNVTPGSTCNVRVRAVGAGNTYGDWSDPITHICT